MNAADDGTSRLEASLTNPNGTLFSVQLEGQATPTALGNLFLQPYTVACRIRNEGGGETAPTVSSTVRTLPDLPGAVAVSLSGATLSSFSAGWSRPDMGGSTNYEEEPYVLSVATQAGTRALGDGTWHRGPAGCHVV